MGHGHSHGSHGHSHSNHGHSHGGDDAASKMLATTVSPGLAARLTSHLSAKDGNELDVFFVTDSKSAAPHAVKLTSFTAIVTGGVTPFTVTFEPAPADERPAGEVDGCSHFVAKASEMEAKTLELSVTAQLALTAGSAPIEVRWEKFDAVKYAHHVE